MTPHNPQEETKKLVFETREEAKVYYYENINKYPPQSDTDYWESQFTQWLSEEKPYIREVARKFPNVQHRVDNPIGEKEGDNWECIIKEELKDK